MTDFINIGQQFVQHYYNTFDTARAVSECSIPALKLKLSLKCC